MGVWPSFGCTPMTALLLVDRRSFCCAVVLQENKTNLLCTKWNQEYY